jgi:hypothetical protein
MQRKQQVGECWVCVIFFARVVVSERMWGLEGGCISAPEKKNFCIGTALYLGGFSAHGFFADGFLFPVKELGFWTNPGHWVRVLDVHWLLYVFCIVNIVT